MLAEQILSPPDVGLLLFAHYLQRLKVQVQRGSELWRGARSTELWDYKIVSYGKRELSSKKFHMLWDQNLSPGSCQQVTGLAGEWNSAVLLAAQEGLTSFVLELFCYFRLDRGIEGIFCVCVCVGGFFLKKNLYLLKICTHERVDRTVGFLDLL